MCACESETNLIDIPTMSLSRDPELMGLQIRLEEGRFLSQRLSNISPNYAVGPIHRVLLAPPCLLPLFPPSTPCFPSKIRNYSVTIGFLRPVAWNTKLPCFHIAGMPEPTTFALSHARKLFSLSPFFFFFLCRTHLYFIFPLWMHMISSTVPFIISGQQSLSNCSVSDECFSDE